MLETEFIRSLQSNYERIHLQDQPDEQRYQYCILTRGGIRGLLPCSLRYINGEAYLYYDITSRQNVAQLYEKQAIDRTWVRDFFWSYEQVRQELGRFLLDEKNILVYPQQIFEDLGNRNFFFLYLPYNEEGNGFEEFFEFVLEHMDYTDQQLVDCLYSMYEQFEKYGDVYLQEQIFEDMRCIEEGENSVKRVGYGERTTIIGEEELFSKPDLMAPEEPAEEVFVKEVQKKKGFWEKLGLIKKKKSDLSKEAYKEPIALSMEGRAVAEEPEYGEEYGRTVYIEQKTEEPGVRKLYAPDGRMVARIEKDIFVIGKHRDEADMVLEDDSVSRLHARIYRQGDFIYLEDLNSTNGTFKNGLRLQPYEKRRLEEDDEVRFGNLLFVYR